MTIKIIRTTAALLAALTSTLACAQVASFDCMQAQTSTEKAVCQTPSLGAQDVRMAVYYQLLIEAHPNTEGMAYREFRNQLRTSQTAWQRQRDTCGAQRSCLANAYQERVNALQQLANQWLMLNPAATVPAPSAIDAGNATYLVENERVTLHNGRAERAATSGSASLNVTTLVPPMAQGQLDGRPGTAVFLSNAPGGSGTFYYVAVAFADGHGLPAVLLGDRIEPRAIAIDNGQVVVRYLARPEQAPRTAKPSVSVTRRFRVAQQRLTESAAPAPSGS